ncbi:multidrug efflux SMR transporter [Schaalia sp. Marseille-Q2122]|uniref:DMT family transporter n=1 Tax=Schaalia sp. Marseille-Q2122 TaxID=2736604 RepID=UPI0020CA4295|nr:multidrug efflux SMR transporter [Schaalia sp. Marseille-Q2122]
MSRVCVRNSESTTDGRLSRNSPSAFASLVNGSLINEVDAAGVRVWRINVAWVVLIGSGLFEAVWATALSKSEGFTRLVPSLVFLVGLIISMAGLAWALREIPVGTGYAVWVGVGAGATVAWAMVTGAETVSVVRVALLIGLIACIAGLKVVGE